MVSTKNTYFWRLDFLVSSSFLWDLGKVDNFILSDLSDFQGLVLFRKEKKKAGNIQDQKLCYVID
jgi:hypothetical protein